MRSVKVRTRRGMVELSGEDALALRERLRRSAASRSAAGTFTVSVNASTSVTLTAGEKAGVLEVLERWAADSSEGAIGRTLDLMCTTDVSVCGEVKLRIQQNLLSNTGKLADITRIYSHAQSLAQCLHWLATHLPTVPRVAVSSNAEAARLAAAESGAAAIAGETAAEIYGLAILAPHIEDEPNNTTRFWVIGRQKVGPSGRDETSLVMSCPNRPGAVYQLLEPLARHGVSMTRFESRPARTGLWEYLFFVDLAGHRDDATLSAALSELAQKAPFLKLLGSYPTALD